MVLNYKCGQNFCLQTNLPSTSNTATPLHWSCRYLTAGRTSMYIFCAHTGCIFGTSLNVVEYTYLTYFWALLQGTWSIIWFHKIFLLLMITVLSVRQTLTILIAVSLFTACLPSGGSILYQLTLGNWVVAHYSVVCRRISSISNDLCLFYVICMIEFELYHDLLTMLYPMVTTLLIT